MVFVDSAEVVRRRAGRNVRAARFEGDVCEQFLIDLRPMFLAGILQIAEFPAVGMGRNPRAFGRIAQRDGEYLDSELGRVPRRLERHRLMVLAVGDQHDRSVAIRLFRHGGDGLANGIADGGAAARRAVGVDRVEHYLEEALVGREGNLDHRLAREHDQPDPVADESIQQVADIRLGPFQPAGGDVLGGHASRDVEHDEHIGPSLHDFAVVASESRPGRSHERQSEGDDDWPTGDPAPRHDQAGDLLHPAA